MVQSPIFVVGGIEGLLKLAPVVVSALRVLSNAVARGDDEIIVCQESLHEAVLTANVRHLGVLEWVRSMVGTSVVVVQRQRLDATLVESGGVAVEVKLPQVVLQAQADIAVLVDALSQQNVALRSVAGISLLELLAGLALVVKLGDHLADRHADKDTSTTVSLRSVAFNLVDVLGKGTNVERHGRVVSGDPLDEGIGRGEESVIIAQNEPLLVGTLAVVVQGGNQGQVAHCHLHGAIRVKHVGIDSDLVQPVPCIIELVIGSIQQQEHKFSSVGVTMAVGEPVGPLVDRASLSIGEAVIGSRDTEKEISQIRRVGGGRPGNRYDKRLRALLIQALLAEINRLSGVWEKELVKLGHTLSVNVLARDLDVALEVLELLSKLILVLEDLEVLGVVVAVHQSRGVGGG